MNDYFGSLMRSSGLGIGAQSPAPALGPVEAGVVEVEIERGPTEVASVPSPNASTAQPAGARAPVSDRASPPVPLQASDAHALPTVQARLATPPQADSGVAADEAADSPPAPVAPSAAEPPQSPLGPTLVRAAMQWVAADPTQARGIAPFVPPPASSEGAAIKAQARAATPARPLREATAPADEPGRAAAPAQQPVALAEPGTRAPEQAPALAIRPARSVPMAPPEPLEPWVRDERVEVSIGAIHLRVDAPAPQTIARPAPAPVVAPRAAALAPRSALSRRALRRI